LRRCGRGHWNGGGRGGIAISVSARIAISAGVAIDRGFGRCGKVLGAEIRLQLEVAVEAFCGRVRRGGRGQAERERWKKERESEWVDSIVAETLETISCRFHNSFESKGIKKKGGEWVD